MIKHLLLPVAAILLSASGGFAQAHLKQTKITRVKNAVTDIRLVDFLNFTYQSSLCSREIRGIGRTVKVRRGKFQNAESYFAVVDDKVIYADATGDGRADAVVHIDCGELAANFSLSEIFIYTLQNGRAARLAEINGKDIERDYNRYYPKGTLWGIADNGVKVRSGRLIIERFAEGSHAAPAYIATFNYRLSGKKFILNGKPQRKRFDGNAPSGKGAPE